MLKDVRASGIKVNYNDSPLNEVRLVLSQNSGIRYHIQSPPLPKELFSDPV